MSTTPEFLQQAPEGIVLRVQGSLYGEDAVASALHKFTDKCWVHLERSADDWLLCRVVPKDPSFDARTVAGELGNSMLDAMLRSRLSKETEAVRRLLIAQAFSHTALIHSEYDEAEADEDPCSIIEPDPGFGKVD